MGADFTKTSSLADSVLANQADKLSEVTSHEGLMPALSSSLRSGDQMMVFAVVAGWARVQLNVQ